MHVITVAATSSPPLFPFTAALVLTDSSFLSCFSVCSGLHRPTRQSFAIITVLLWLLFKYAFSPSCCLQLLLVVLLLLVWGVRGYLTMVHFNYAAPAESTPAAK